jgi:hypothetical protein
VSFAVEVQTVAVRLVGAGLAVDGEVFLHVVGGSGHPETLGERLNDLSVRFLPCRVDGRVELVRVDGISFVEARAPLPELREIEEVGAVRQQVDVELAGGYHLGGELVYTRPPGSQRVSDLLNSGAERFLLLLDGDQARYLRRDALVRVRTL